MDSAYDDWSLGIDGKSHYSDVIMGEMASQITSLTIVYSTVFSGADQRKHHSSASLVPCGEFTGDRWQILWDVIICSWPRYLILTQPPWQLIRCAKWVLCFALSWLYRQMMVDSFALFIHIFQSIVAEPSTIQVTLKDKVKQSDHNSACIIVLNYGKICATIAMRMY